MPKILVLHAAQASGAHTVADRVAAGVRSVRFAEVAVRRLPPRAEANEGAEGPAGNHRALDPSETLTSQDAVVLVAESAEEAAALAPLLRDAPPDIVLGVAAPEPAVAWALLTTAASSAVLLPPHTDPEALGARAATVAGWVRHVKGHAGHHH